MEFESSDDDTYVLVPSTSLDLLYTLRILENYKLPSEKRLQSTQLITGMDEKELLQSKVKIGTVNKNIGNVTIEQLRFFFMLNLPAIIISRTKGMLASKDFKASVSAIRLNYQGLASKVLEFKGGKKGIAFKNSAYKFYTTNVHNIKDYVEDIVSDGGEYFFKLVYMDFKHRAIGIVGLLGSRIKPKFLKLYNNVDGAMSNTGFVNECKENLKKFKAKLSQLGNPRTFGRDEDFAEFEGMFKMELRNQEMKVKKYQERVKKALEELNNIRIRMDKALSKKDKNYVMKYKSFNSIYGIDEVEKEHNNQIKKVEERVVSDDEIDDDYLGSSSEDDDDFNKLTTQNLD
jgi:hypothetical protein